MGPLAPSWSASIRRTRRATFTRLWFNVILGADRAAPHRDPLSTVAGQKLTLPMITGRGEVEPGTEPMRPGKWWVALICLAVGIGITRWIIAGAPPFGP